MTGPLILYKNFATLNPATIASGVVITGVAGTVGGDAVYAVNYPWTITSDGTLQAAGTTGIGVDLLTGGSLDNEGLVTGYKNGVAVGGTISGVAATIANSGTIVSPSIHGSAVYAAAEVAVTNSGKIAGTGADGTGIDLAAGGTVINGSTSAPTATISGIGAGIFAVGNSPDTVSNYGTVTNSATTVSNYGVTEAVYLKDGGLVANLGYAALIEGYASYGVRIAEGIGTVDNTGTIESAGVFAKSAIKMYAGIVVNGSAADTRALIATGRADGIDIASGTGTVTNYGTVSGLKYGIFAAGGTVINGGLVSSGNPLVYSPAIGVRLAGNGGTNLLINSGTINYGGASLQGGGTVDNTGLISGQLLISGNAGIVTNSGILADGTELNAGLPKGSLPTGTLTNTGQVTNGVSFFYENGIILNSGTIIGTGKPAYPQSDFGRGAGIYGRQGNLTITNLGSIGSASYGVFGTAGSAAIVTNGTAPGSTASISGGSIAIDSASFVYNFGTVTATGTAGIAVIASEVVNHGVITGATAVSTYILIEYPGAALNGAIAGTVLELAAGASPAVLSGVGTPLVNFGTLTFEPGASWDVQWQTPFARPAQFPSVVTGFQQGDTIDASGLVVNGYTYSGGVLALENNGSIVAQATLSTPYANPVFVLTPDGNGGTDITVGVPYTASDPLMTNTAGALVFDQVVNGQMLYTTIGGLGSEWEFDGTGNNLLGDGNPGFLIRDTGTVAPGAVYVGEVVNGQAQYTQIGALGPEWQFEGVNDFLGNGQSQFLIENTGTIEPGALDLGQVVSGSAQYTQIGALGPEWQFDGTGDFLADGQTGFLIRNTGTAEPGALDVGEIANGSVTYTPIGGVGPEWDFEGTGDFFGDGHTDFLIWNSGSAELGAMAIGEVVNGSLQFTDIGGVGPEWQFVGTGNYIDSSKTDFLLRNSNSGALVVGSVSGATGNGSVSFTTVGAVGPEWTFHNTNPALLA